MLVGQPDIVLGVDADRVRELNIPAPQDPTKLPSRSKITTGCSLLRLKQ